jgi:hypothetical protein
MGDPGLGSERPVLVMLLLLTMVWGPPSLFHRDCLLAPAEPGGGGTLPGSYLQGIGLDLNKSAPHTPLTGAVMNILFIKHLLDASVRVLSESFKLNQQIQIVPILQDEKIEA